MNKDGHLKAIFIMMMSLLHSSFDELRALQAAGGFASAVDSSGSFSWVEPCIAVLNLVFSWDFSDQEDKAGVIRALSVNRGEIITPGPLWRDVLVQPATIDLFYSLHSLCRENQKLGHEVRQCLVDLAAIRGDVFADEVSSQVRFFRHWSSSARCGCACASHEKASSGFLQLCVVKICRGPRPRNLILVIWRD
jgi:hypothetical protein